MNFPMIISNITRNEDIKNTIRDKAELKKIRERYKSLNIQNLNETSLVMYHAPLQSNVMSRNLQTTPVEMTNIPNRRSINVEKSIGHFLTGDINFNINLKEMQEHFNGYLSRVESALVPHHGSAENWNKTALDLIPHSCLWITSSGITNKYGHPSPSVCDQIRKNGNLLENVNEGNEICTRESLFF